MGFLEGKKTYITAIATILTATGSYLAGQIEFAGLLQTVSMALIGAFVRHGISSTSKK